MKNYALGIITGISITVSIMMYINTNANNDFIQTRSLAIVDEKGIPRIVLSSNNSKPQIVMMNDDYGSVFSNTAITFKDIKKDKIPFVYNSSVKNSGILMKSGKNQVILSPKHIAFDEDKVRKVELNSGDNEYFNWNSQLKLFNHKGENIIYLGGYDNDGFIELMSKDGKRKWNKLVE
tara:strand:+ start:330 stop:863 length:534 start_codon:yes stop_codon:yes gene_type:complete